MTWTQDYCTVCDKQCPQGSVYCSDSCRLFEERAIGLCAPEQIHNLVYSSLYTTGKHVSLSSPRCDCIGSECVCGANPHGHVLDHLSNSQGSSSVQHSATVGSAPSGYKGLLYNSPLLGPTSRATSRGSIVPISSSLGNSYVANQTISPPPSPLLIASTRYPLKNTASSHPSTRRDPSPPPSNDMTADYLSRTGANYRKWLSAS